MNYKEFLHDGKRHIVSFPPTGILLLFSGTVLILCSILYNEFIVALFVKDLPLIFRAIPRIRNSQIDFLLWGLGLIAFALLTQIRWLGSIARKPVAINLLLAITTAALPITILELTLRPFAFLSGRATNIFINDEELGWKLKPLARGKASQVNVAINSKGVRDREIPYTHPSNRKRILFIGDSVTFGFGLEEEQTFPYLVQKIQTVQYPPQPKMLQFAAGYFFIYRIAEIEIVLEKTDRGRDLENLCARIIFAIHIQKFRHRGMIGKIRSVTSFPV